MPDAVSQLVTDNVGAIDSGTGIKLASLVGQYSNAGALLMVGWVLYQTIGIELPAMREQTYVRTQAIVNTMERMKESIDQQSRLMNDLAKELREARTNRKDG